MMHLILVSFLMLSSSGCQAQMQGWQKERTVEHLSRLKSYRGQISWAIAGETSETEIWFQAPNRFLTVTKNGEIVRSDGSTMEIYDPRTKFHSVFRNLPPVAESDGPTLIQNLFDQSMKLFSFTLGPIGKVAGRTVIELRAAPKGNSVIVRETSQIFDEYSFPLKSVATFKGGQTAKYEFTSVAFNESFELPKAEIPKGSFKLEWDFKGASPKENEKAVQFQDLKLEKVLKRETGEVLSYYKNGAQFVSVIRYKHLGATTSRGISIKVGQRDGHLLPGPVSNVLTVSDSETTWIYSSNLLIDDLIAFAAK